MRVDGRGKRDDKVEGLINEINLLGQNGYFGRLHITSDSYNSVCGINLENEYWTSKYHMQVQGLLYLLILIFLLSLCKTSKTTLVTFQKGKAIVHLFLLFSCFGTDVQSSILNIVLGTVYSFPSCVIQMLYLSAKVFFTLG